LLNFDVLNISFACVLLS